jgi:hypothetical protein
MQKKLIFYIILIIVILVLLFLSQQAYSRWIGKTLISDATNQAEAYLAKGSNWVMSKIYPAISGEVQKRGDMIPFEINQIGQKIGVDIPNKIKNYFSGVVNSILHPGQSNNCPTQPSQTSTGQ